MPNNWTALLRHILLILLILLSSCAVPAADAQTLSSTKPPHYPWHLVDIWWDSAQATPSFKEIAIDFHLIGQLSPQLDLYIAPLGLAKIGDTAVYGGVQTRGNGWRSKTDQRLQNLGSIGIFSKWSADNSPIPLEQATGTDGTHFFASDNENNYLSVRRKFTWQAGHYTYFLRQKKIDGEAASWFTASVKNQQSQQETEIGALKIVGTELPLAKAMNAFVEIYGSSSPIPRLAIVIEQPRIDGQWRFDTRSKIIYPNNNTSGQARFATAFPFGKQIFIYLVPPGIGDGLKQETLQ